MRESGLNREGAVKAKPFAPETMITLALASFASWGASAQDADNPVIETETVILESEEGEIVRSASSLGYSSYAIRYCGVHLNNMIVETGYDIFVEELAHFCQLQNEEQRSLGLPACLGRRCTLSFSRGVRRDKRISVYVTYEPSTHIGGGSETIFLGFQFGRDLLRMSAFDPMMCMNPEFAARQLGVRGQLTSAVREFDGVLGCIEERGEQD